MNCIIWYAFIFKSVGKVEKNPMKKGAEGQFYEILEDICDRCHSNALSKKIFY